MLRLIVVMFFLFFHFTSYAGYTPLKKIKISNIEESRIVDPYRELILKAYAGIGYRVTFIEMPLVREIIEINKGTVDAILIRLSAIEHNNPDLIRVPVTLETGGLFLYCQIELPCDQSVMDEPLNLIGGIIGVNSTTIYLKAHAASVYKVTAPNQLTEMLSKKRLNYILTLEIDDYGNYMGLDKSKYNSVKLESVKAYHYIHRRIERILPELTLSLKSVIDENNKH